jgi:hypothetical protein
VAYYTVVPLGAFFGAIDPDGAALFGWPQVAQAVTAQADTLDQPLLLTTDYRSASALAYTLNNPDVLAISGRLDQFDFWYDAPALDGRDAVLLGETWHPICPTHLALFDRVTPPETLEIRQFGHVLQTYEIVRGYGFRAGPEGYPCNQAIPWPSAAMASPVCPSEQPQPSGHPIGLRGAQPGSPGCPNPSPVVKSLAGCLIGTTIRYYRKSKPSGLGSFSSNVLGGGSRPTFLLALFSNLRWYIP